MKNLVSKKIQGPGYVVVVHSPKGGCGKTTTAANLVANLISQGYSVQAIDLDLQGNINSTCNSYFQNYMEDGYGRLKIKYAPIKNSRDAYNKMTNTLVSSVKNPKAQRNQGDELIQVSVPIELLAEIPYLQEENDFVVIDTPGVENPFLTQLILLSDLALIPVYPSNYDLASLTNLVTGLVATAETLNIDPTAIPVMSLLNNCDKKDPLAKRVRELLDASGLPCASTIIPRRNHYRKITFTSLDLGDGSSSGKPYFHGPKRDTAPCIEEQNELLEEIFYFLQNGYLPNQAETQAAENN